MLTNSANPITPDRCQAVRSLASSCPRSAAVYLKRVYARKLIGARTGLFAEHLVDGLLRGETTARFGAYQTPIQSGWISRNEARALENLHPVAGLDEMLVPLNSGPNGQTD